jgi:hypothetical protein
VHASQREGDEGEEQAVVVHRQALRLGQLPVDNADVVAGCDQQVRVGEVAVLEHERETCPAQRVDDAQGLVHESARLVPERRPPGEGAQRRPDHPVEPGAVVTARPRNRQPVQPFLHEGDHPLGISAHGSVVQGLAVHSGLDEDGLAVHVVEQDRFRIGPSALRPQLLEAAQVRPLAAQTGIVVDPARELGDQARLVAARGRDEGDDMPRSAEPWRDEQAAQMGGQAEAVESQLLASGNQHPLHQIHDRSWSRAGRWPRTLASRTASSTSPTVSRRRPMLALARPAAEP